MVSDWRGHFVFFQLARPDCRIDASPLTVHFSRLCCTWHRNATQEIAAQALEMNRNDSTLNTRYTCSISVAGKIRRTFRRAHGHTTIYGTSWRWWLVHCAWKTMGYRCSRRSLTPFCSLSRSPCQVGPCLTVVLFVILWVIEFVAWLAGVVLSAPHTSLLMSCCRMGLCAWRRICDFSNHYTTKVAGVGLRESLDELGLLSNCSVWLVLYLWFIKALPSLSVVFVIH